MPDTPTLRKKGSGRTKGANSFVNLTLCQLKGKFNDDTTPIRVSRLWAQELGFQDLISMPAKDLAGKVEGFTPTSKIQFTVREL